MPYTVPAEVRLALAPGIINPADPPVQKSQTGADLPNTQLIDAIAEADAQIDSYIGKYYATPVAPVDGVVPHPVDFWSRNIAAYNATLTWRKGQDIEDTDPVVRRWKMTMDQLSAVAKGAATLPLPPNSGDSAAAGAGQALNPNFGTMFPMQDFSIGYGHERRGVGYWGGSEL